MPERDRIETAVERIRRNIEAAKAIKAEIELLKESKRRELQRQ